MQQVVGRDCGASPLGARSASGVPIVPPKECRRVACGANLISALEAETCRRFASSSRRTPGIRIPGLTWELSSRRVLCWNLLPGIKISTDRPALGGGPASIRRGGGEGAAPVTCRCTGCASRLLFTPIPSAPWAVAPAVGPMEALDLPTTSLCMGQIGPHGLRKPDWRMVRAQAGRDASALWWN